MIRPHLFGLLAGLALAAGLVLSAMLVTRAWIRVTEAQVITVTGSARKPVVSDLGIWRGSFSVENSELLSAQEALKADLGKVEAFLTEQGMTNFLVKPIDIQELRSAHRENSPPKTTGYRLRQTVEVRSTEVERIAALGIESTALVEQGVLFTPSAPEYIYTKAAEAKLEMLAEATKDARARAEQIARQGGREIARLGSARMGVFQITPIYSTEVSWGGINDTTSKEKMITSVVNATFSLK